MAPDPELVAWFQADLARMAAFDDLAGRYGQGLECALARPEDPDLAHLVDHVIVRYRGGDVLAVIAPDASVDVVGGDR